MSVKHIFTLLFLIIFLQKGITQERRFNAGLILGGNASQIQGDAEAGYNKLGLLAGVTAQIRIAEKSEIGLEIAFNQLGSRSTSNNPGFFPFKSTLNYVAVPVYFKFKDWLADGEEAYYKLHFMGGFSYNRLISTKMEGNPFEAVDDFIRDDYAGILLGAVYFINSQLGVGGRWERSIIDLYNNNLNNGGPLLDRPLWSKHLTFYVTYSFL